MATAWLTPPPAGALLCNALLGCTCTVTATDVDFGAFTPLDGEQAAEGEVSIACSGVIDVAPSVVVRLSGGQSGAPNARVLRSDEGYQLNYGIYTTSQHSTVWGNGAGGTSTVTVSGGVLALGHWSAQRTMFAASAPSPTTFPGAYDDLITVRIDW